MLEFRVQNLVPPGGKYFYAVDGKEGTVEFEAYTRDTILMDVGKYYRANGEPVPDDIWLRIQDYMCRRIPESFCLGDAEGKPRAKVITLQSVRKLVQSVLLTQGRKFVEKGVAEKRAHVCAACPFNDRTMCATCFGLVKWGERTIGGMKTPYNQCLGICAKDTLLLPVKVFLANLPQCKEELPNHCWARR